MASLNKVFLIGNLTRDPEVRYTPSGTAVGDLRLAVNRRFRGSDGQDREDTCFVNVTAWGRTAEVCGEYLRKGSPLLVEGRLKYDEWERDGQKFNRLSVVAERTQFIGAPRGELRDTPGSPRPSGTQPPEGGTHEEQAPEPPGPESQAPGRELASDDDDLPF